MAAQRAPLLLAVALILFYWGGLVSAQQGLVMAPPTLQKKLGSYYLNSLGAFFDYYSLLTQRNRITNAYLVINGLPNDIPPMEAAEITSSVRATYSKRTMGGKVVVNTYWKLFRCEPPCVNLDRISVASMPNPGAASRDVLVYAKAHVGNTGWLLNPNQRSLTDLMAKPSVKEVPFVDVTYGSKLYYKLDTAPSPPCSFLEPQTSLGAIGHFDNATQFVCISVQGVPMAIVTDREDGHTAMVKYSAPAASCDGSVTLFYTEVALTLSGATALTPRLVKLVNPPGSVPYTLRWTFPSSSAGSNCSLDTLYADAEATLQAAALLATMAVPYWYEPNGLDGYPVPAAVERLGFNSSADCEISTRGPRYSSVLGGQTNDIGEVAARNQSFRQLSFIPYNQTQGGVCLSMLPVTQPDDIIDRLEDLCAEALFRGPTFQLREYLARTNDDTADSPFIASIMANITDACRESYALDVVNLLPEMAIDFETIKSVMLASTEVKVHQDSVAANAASVLAVEVALGSIGIVIAHTIARSRFYRSSVIKSSAARLLAVVLTAVAITLLNIPNFVLISRSLENHDSPGFFTQVGTNQYRPSNFSTVLFTETHSFVRVESSRATAYVGLVLYSVTLCFATYVTWGEFTDVIRRKNEALSRLGSEALESDKHVLVEWRATDSLLHDTMHPRAVVEAGVAAEIQLLQRAAAGRQMGAGEHWARLDSPKQSLV